MAKNYDLFLERMKQKYNVPQQSQQNQNILQQQNVLNKSQDIYYNPSKAEQPQVQEEKNDFQKLNLWNKIGAGYHQARTSFETSFLDLGEGVIDAILTGVGSVADWVGADGLSDTMNDWVKAEWLSALPEKDWFNDYFGLDFLFSEEAQEVGRKDEALPEIVDQVSSGIGSAVGYGLLNMVPVVGPALAWMGGGGAAAEQALNEGASNTEAMLYGGAVGGVEFATEKFLGKGLEKAGLGLGKFAGWGKGTSTAAKQVGKSAMSKIVSNVGKNFFEEGMEEVVSEIVDPLIKKGTYKRDENLKELYGEQISIESLAETFLIGGLTGGIFEGANIAGGIAKSGGVKNWDIRQEAQQLQIINSQMEQAILEGDEQKLKELQSQKEKAIKSVEDKFNNFVEETKLNPRLGKIVSQATYEVQRDMSQEDLILDATKKVFNAKSKKDGTPKINVKFSETDANGVQEASHYSKSDNTIYLNKQNLNTLQNALETIAHETGHAIHTSGLNTNFVNQMLTDFTDFDSLIENEANKGTVTNIEEMISYYENEKGYGKVLEDSNLLKQRMQEKKISKEQAYQELRNDYMLEEIANDIFSKKYFNNLLELQAVISGAKPNKIRKIKEAYRKRFANTSNKPSNYKEVMQIFNDGINQNYDRYVDTLVGEEQTTDKKYKTITEEELENAVDSNGNKLSKEQIEYFKNSAVRDENGNLLVVYHGTFYGGFTIFNENSYDNVVFFTNDKFMASTYSGYNENDIEFGKENTGLYSVYLNIEKPLIVDARDSNWDNITFYQKKPKDYQNEYNAVNSLKNLQGFVNNFFYKRTSKLDYRISRLQNLLSKIENGEISIEDKHFELELQQEIASLEKQKENLEDVLNPKNIQDLLNEVNKNVENDLKFEFVKNDKWLQPTILLKGKYFEDYITLDFLVNNIEKLNYYFDRMVQARALYRLESNFKTLMTTREIVEYAQKQGKYDGVIIRNVYDYSGPVGVDTETTPSQDVYVTLKSPNQIKDIRNQNPTENDDIRYKLSELNDENDIDLEYIDVEEFDKLNDDLLDEIDEDIIDEWLGELLLEEVSIDFKNRRNRKWLEERNLEKQQKKDEYDSLSDEQKRNISLKKSYLRDYQKLVSKLNEKMSEQQKDFFKDSVIRNRNGLLIPMFHGTQNSDMYFFDDKKIGKNGTVRGHGFYLTNNLSYAESYTGENGKVIMAFVNIKKPLSDWKQLISKSDIKRFIKENVDSTGEDWLSNYGDVYSEGYQKVLDKAVDSLYKYNSSDAEIIESIFVESRMEYEDYFAKLTEMLGYDGVVYDRAEGLITLAFNSNQIKDIENRQPTLNKDVRYKLSENKPSPLLDTTELDNFDLSNYETKEEIINIATDVTLKIDKLFTSMSEDAKIIEDSKVDYETSKKAYDDYIAKIDILKKWRSNLKSIYEKMKNQKIKSDLVFEQVVKNLGKNSFPYKDLKTITNLLNSRIEWNSGFKKALTDKKQGNIKIEETKEQENKNLELKDRYQESSNRIDEFGAKTVRNNYFNIIEKDINDLQYDKSLLEKDINDLKDEINEITYKNYKDKTKLDSIDEKIKSFENTIKEIPQKAKQVLQKTGVYEEFGLHKEKILKEFKEIEELLKDYEYETITTRVVLSKIDASIDKIELLLDNKDYGDNLKKMGLTQMIDTFESSITKEQYAVKEYAKETIETFKKDLQELDNKLENFASKRNKIEQTKVAQELKPQAQKTKQDYLTKLKPLQEKTNVSQESKDLLDALEKEINSINYTNFENNDKINKITDDLFNLDEKITKEIAEAEELKKQQELEEELKKQAELEEKAKKEKAQSKPKVENQQATTAKEKKIKVQAKEFNENLQQAKIIRETRIRYTESAKSVKETADSKLMVKYTKQACDNLLNMVGEMLQDVGSSKKFVTKLWFKNVEGGRNQIRDEMFEAFNTLSDNPQKLAERIIELIKKGIYVQVQDFTLNVEPDKVELKNQSRQTFMLEDMAGYSKTNTSGLFKVINENLTSMVEDTIKNAGKPTVLAKRIAEKTSQMQKQIDNLTKEIENLRKEISKETKTIVEETKNATTNEQIKAVDKKISENNKRIAALEKKLGETLPKKQKVIDELKTNNKNLKEDLKSKTKEVKKLTMEKIAAETQLEGTFTFDNRQKKYIKKLVKETFGYKGEIDTETLNKISKLFNKGDFFNLANTLIDFLKDKEIDYAYMEINEETLQMEEVVEKVPFTTVYPSGVNDLLLEGLSKQIAYRMLNKRVTKRSPLPLALENIAELKGKMKADKETTKLLKGIKNKLTSISKLSLNKKKSLLSNNIDKRFRAFSNELGKFSKLRMLNGEFRQTLLEFKNYLTEEKIELEDGSKQTFSQITGIELPQQIVDKINELSQLTGEVTLDELKMYDEILDAINKFIEKGTGARLTNFVKGKDANGNNIYYTVEEFAEEAIKEQEEIIQKLGISKEKFRKILQTVDPRVIFKILSGFNENSKLYMLFEELQKGDTKTMEKYMSLRKDLDDFNKQNKKFKKKVLKEKIIINDVKATKGEFISIYKSLNRDAAKKHILKNGFIVGGIKYRFSGEQEISDLYNAIETTLELKNENSLMAKYYKLTTKFFEDAGKAKAEIDRLLYGFADIEQGEYFPIHINSLDFNRTIGDKQYVSKMAASFNYSWQQAVVGDGGALAIDNVQDIIDVHSKQVADYYGYGVPLDLFNEIYSFKIYDPNTKRQKSLKEIINTRFGYDNKSKKYLVEDYLKVLFDDIRGINTYSGESDKVFKKAFSSLRKKYSTYVLGANLKTAVVQLGAIPGAYKYISLKNMLKAAIPFSKEMKEKYPLPTLGKYRTYDKTILQSQTLNDEIGDLAEKFGILMTKTDQATIKYAWKCALIQTNFNVKEATKLFEKIVRETQPQYSAIERSALMRSKNDLVKLFTQFQSQSNKNFSTMVEVVYKAIYYKKMGMELSKQDKMMFYKATVSVATQGVFAVAIAYLFKFLLNDLDEEDKDPLAIISNFINETILGIVPLMNNIRVDLTGNGKFFKIIDFYEPSLGMIDKLSDALTDIGQLANPDKTTPSKIYDTVNAFGMVLGIPTENIYKYSMGILKWVFPNKAFTWDATTKNISMANKSEINDALKEGKVNVAKQYYDTYTSNILELDDKTITTLFNLYKEGYTNAYIKQIPKTLVIDNEQVKVDKKEFLKTYSQLTPKLKQVVNSPAFNSLNKEEKEKVISKLVNTYYSLSKKEIIGDEEYSDIELLVKYNKNFNHKNIAYLVHISNIEETKTKTRKEIVQKYINSLPLSAGEKYLLYVLSGYSISDKNTKILRSFLSAIGMPKKQINILLE